MCIYYTAAILLSLCTNYIFDAYVFDHSVMAFARACNVSSLSACPEDGHDT